MNITKARKLFPYAGISVTNGKLSLIYSPTNERGISVHEEICDEIGNKQYFDHMLESSDKVEISVSEKFAKMVFYSETFNNWENLKFLPLRRPQTGKEIDDMLEEIIRSSEATEALKDLQWFFKGVNLDNTAQVGEALRGWSEYESQFEEPEPVELSSYIKWRDFSTFIPDFREASAGADFAVFNPGDCGDLGWCEVEFGLNSKKNLVFEHEGLNAFRKIVKASGLISLDTEIMDDGNSILITLFP